MSENPSPNDGVIDAFGVPGYLGRPAGEIRRKCEPEGFEKAFWISKPSRESDLYVVFQTSIRAESGSYTFAIQSSGNFQLVIDSEIAIRGPVRFSSHLPENY